MAQQVPAFTMRQFSQPSNLLRRCQPPAWSSSKVTLPPCVARCSAASSNSNSSSSSSSSSWQDNYAAVFAPADAGDVAVRRLRIRRSQRAKRSGGQLPPEQAASLAAQQMQLDAQDALAGAMAQLQAASQSEDYAAAAQVRDSALAWLEGWWTPLPSPSSGSSGGGARGVSSGSLLYIKREYGRWAGRLFTPGDFMSFDMACSTSSSIDLTQLLADPRYGTPLLEAYVLPGAGDAGAAGASSSGSFSSVVVALQSVQRAMNELLRVETLQPRASRPSVQAVGADDGEPLPLMNQRLLLLLDGGVATAAAVHGGNDATLLVWRAALPTGGSSGADSASNGNSEQPAVAAAASIEGPVRPAEQSNGVFRVTFNIDWHEIDLMRGAGTIEQCSTSEFRFVRHALPAVTCRSMCSSSSSSSGACDGARLFRVDLQYQLQGAARVVGSDDGEAASSIRRRRVSDSGSSGSERQPGWAARIAAELSQLAGPQGAAGSNGSSGSSQLEGTLAALLHAAAAGTAPVAAVVSEASQPVHLVEVPLDSGADSAADTLDATFSKVVGQTAHLQFGSWQVAALLPQA